MDTHAGGPRLRELALFAGAGGGIWASRWFLGWRTIGYVEIDSYCQRVLQARIRDGHFDDAPIWDDIKSFDGKPWHGRVDVVTAGFPCQPFSVAGQKKGKDDERNLWPDTARVIREIRPRFVFLENVLGLLAGSHGYFGSILRELAEAGHDAEWTVLGADDVGAPHRRKRLWVLAYATSEGLEGGRREPRRWAEIESERSRPIVADAVGTGLERRQGIANDNGEERATIERSGGQRVTWWDADPAEGPVESRVDRVVDRLAFRCDRLRAIGNGQTSLVAARAWHELSRRMKCESGETEKS